MNSLSDAIAVAAFSVLAGSGTGGGGLLVVYLTVFRGTGQIDAQLRNLASFVAASCAALPIHFRDRSVDPALLAVFCAGGIPGTFIGALLRSRLPARIVSKIFGAVLIVGGVSVLAGILKDSLNRGAGSRRE